MEEIYVIEQREGEKNCDKLIYMVWWITSDSDKYN